MIESCLASGTHYLDITAEVDVLEFSNGLDAEARRTGVVLCSGVGFDVIATDCIAARLASALPDAVYLALAISGGSGFSPGMVKTMLEALASPVRVRRNGRITSIPWGSRTRSIDLGEGERLAMAITWGDVATAWYTTGIPNIDVYVPASGRALRIVRAGRSLAWVLRMPLVRSALTTWIEKSVNGPDERERESTRSLVWGEVKNVQGVTRSARLVTANGYSFTVWSAPAAVGHLLNLSTAGGSYTPSRLLGSGIVTRVAGIGPDRDGLSAGLCGV